MIEALNVSHLTCRYKDAAVLNDLTFQVEKGEIVCLLGASGCGKTTLLKAIAGLLPLENGKIEINQRVVADTSMNMPPEGRNVGMIFQDYALFPHLTVAKNVGFGLKSMSQIALKQRVDEMLALVKLDGLNDRYPHQLSGGQQQRVAIARALAYKPDLLLLDEPFSNIDSQVRHALIQEIRRLFKAQGVTAIFVTHSHEEAFAFADKLAVMNQGVIEQYGTTTALYHQPCSRFVAQFLGHRANVPVQVIAPKKMQTPFGLQDLPNALPLGDYEWFIRPQNLMIAKNDTAAASVLDVHFMGDSTRYLVGIGEQTFLVYSNQLLQVGDSVDIHIYPHQPIVFPVTGEDVNPSA